MIANFFQFAAIPANQLIGSFNLSLVALSFMVAMAASYIALDLTGRLRDINNTPASKLLWLVGGSIAMGAGIWSMHFIGMLSFTIPGLTLRYDLFWTALSLLVAILASGFALFLLQSDKIRIEHYITGGIILGIAIASMHYTGMEGMLITLNIRYLPSLFFLSVLIAIVASEAALWLALKSNQVILRNRTRIKLASALIMGFAICGMHYTGMAASIFTPLCTPTCVLSNAQGLDPNLLSIGIAGVTFIILGVAFFASAYKESLNQQQFEKARQLGMAEISASILHNIGNVLNSVNVATGMITERFTSSKLSSLEKLSSLFNEHQHNLSTFIKEDPQGNKAVELLNKLAKYWREEHTIISNELNRLNNNVVLMKNIIAAQQELSKIASVAQIISINELLDEALLITGVNLKNEIIVIKNYSKISPIKTDKVKLLQILINLIHNAKESILESHNINKQISITTSLTNKKRIIIVISDNGVGILPKDIKKIFNYGFTTKKTGHGFGLHNSAIAINELGGTITVKSDGLNKGASFTLELKVTTFDL
jgi:NO-binding membrane sensor protein with MHYT domain